MFSKSPCSWILRVIKRESQIWGQRSLFCSLFDWNEIKRLGRLWSKFSKGIRPRPNTVQNISHATLIFPRSNYNLIARTPIHSYLSTVAGRLIKTDRMCCVEDGKGKGVRAIGNGNILLGSVHQYTFLTCKYRCQNRTLTQEGMTHLLWVIQPCGQIIQPRSHSFLEL